jgi:hypothetical protein
MYVCNMSRLVTHGWNFGQEIVHLAYGRVIIASILLP